ncbi:hypothetical protein J2Z69_000315 [Paenibacillus shirakamiensis]|uniref:Uncharacterized protein n=1 Tax=Paenibacillus shirakamiensis TaxID=1265935 RepID=A0ABS4JC54_9BACL|nr:hypothetical protein [Paenibacillus shirakamiensis]MBP1999296.1 hypothetical protein [Paenibacillus shirakamiensis]
MARIKATRQPDLVLIQWTRNPLIAGSSRRITAARLIGNSSPCQFDLKPKALLSTALACLQDNDVGFRIVYRKRTSAISGYLLLQR